MAHTFIDLFAGIGGFRMGFENAGYKCVFSSEKDDKCREVYNSNFNELPYGDIKNIDSKDIPDFDVLLAGFPCQPFSISGKKLGFEDTRGTLFFDVCRIIKEKQPKVAILENVKHLIHHDGKRTFNVVISSLIKLGYEVSYQILNAKDFGLPQNRERIFIIATKKSRFHFHLLKNKPKTVLSEFLDKTGVFEFLDKSEYTLIEEPKRQATGLIFVGYRNKNTWKTGVRPNTEHLSRVHRQPNRIYSIEGVHPTIPSQETSGRFFIYSPKEDLVRKLTIKECYRIMGFHEKFNRHDTLGEQYKQIGNSVAIPVIEAVAKSVLEQGLLTNESQREIVRNIQGVLFR